MASTQELCTTVTLAPVCSSRPAGHTPGALVKRCLAHTERQWHRLGRRRSAANREVKQGSRGTGQRQVSDTRDCKDPVARRHPPCYGRTPHGIWSSRTHLNHKGYILLSSSAHKPHTGALAEVAVLCYLPVQGVVQTSQNPFVPQVQAKASTTCFSTQTQHRRTMSSTSMSMLTPGARAWQSLSARLQQLPSRQVPALHAFAFFRVPSAPL